MIRFNKVSLKYDNSSYALKDVTLQIKEGEFVFVVGKTGAGKSSLFKLLTREIIPSSGSIKVFNDNIEYITNSDLPYYRRQLGVVFQNYKLLKDRNSFENVAFAQEIIGVNSFKIKKRVLNLLNYVGIRHKAAKMPNELSGGEQQKVAIARAIINKPKIILADEPTGNLDEVSKNEIMDLFQMINESGTTVVIITHDLHLVSKMKKRVIRLDEGEVIYDGIGLDSNIREIIN